MSADAFRCGHPKTHENSYTTGNYPTCRLCNRIRKICYAANRDQERLNAGLPVAVRRGGHKSRYGDE